MSTNCVLIVPAVVLMVGPSGLEPPYSGGGDPHVNCLKKAMPSTDTLFTDRCCYGKA